jgi:uncharacterized Zn-binding protein involved in type VI secretion
MPKVARNGDVCGGLIIATATKTYINGKLVARIGDSITSHGIGKHASATMVGGSSTVFAEGIGVCRLGDVASCGHAISTASSDTEAN